MNELAKSVLNGIYSVVGNYGWSMVVFTLFIRLLMLPFDYKSRVGMRKTAKIQPKMEELRRKYAKDQDKLNRKMSELYKQEHVNPLSGCLPMLISWPFILWMWSAMRAIANEQTVQQVITLLQNPSELPVFEGWLWIRNVWMPDSPFASVLPDINTLIQVPSEVWTQYMTPQVLASLPAELSQLTVDSFAKDTLQATINTIGNYLTTTPVYQAHSGVLGGWTFNLLIAQFSIMKEYNGYFLLPVLSCVSQFLMTKMTGQQQPAADPNAQGQSTMKFMNWFFPLFSLWICAQYNGAFALYWVTSNLIMMATTFGINRYLDSKEAKEKEKMSVEGTVE